MKEYAGHEHDEPHVPSIYGAVSRNCGGAPKEEPDSPFNAAITQLEEPYRQRNR
jgi:hypothetical protein